MNHMINVLHLLWIVPIAASFAVMIFALFIAGGDDDG